MGESRQPPELLTTDEAKALLKRAEQLWSDLQKNDLGGFSGGNRPFYILWMMKQVIEVFGRRDIGQTWSKDELDSLAKPVATSGYMQSVPEPQWSEWFDWTGGECPIPWAKEFEWSFKAAWQTDGREANCWATSLDWSAPVVAAQITTFRYRLDRAPAGFVYPPTPAPASTEGESVAWRHRYRYKNIPDELGWDICVTQWALTDKPLPEGSKYRSHRDFEEQPLYTRPQPDERLKVAMELLDAYEASTKKLPLGHEQPALGCSSFNWRMAVICELRAILSAIKDPTS